jgi:3-deoxy-D-arabino-heptulosonate 7-phosphate (DAHP) synthase
MIGRLRKDRPIFLRRSERRTDLQPMRSTNMNSDCRLVSRERHPTASVVRVGDAAFGGEAIPVIAGPCSVETNPQMAAAADAVAAAFAALMATLGAVARAIGRRVASPRRAMLAPRVDAGACA